MKIFPRLLIAAKRATLPRPTIAATRFAIAAAVFVLLSPTSVVPQNHPGLVTISAAALSSDSDLQQSDALVERMIQDAELISRAIYDDRLLPSRTHERLSQYYKGVRVYGGDISRQTAEGVTVSVFGTIYTQIDVDPTPAISTADAVATLENVSGADLVANSPPSLVILPMLDGSYALTYRVTMRNFKTYFVSAHTGQVLAEIDEIKSQSEVGTGQGALGDQKKVSATKATGEFQAWDQLRPAQIRTLDSRGSEPRLFRYLSGSWSVNDLADDSDNLWTAPGVVDGHVHTGWAHDYFFKRHGWTGLNGTGGAIFDVVNDFSVPFSQFNAFFIPPPFGPTGQGALVWGETSAGTPLTSLDIVGHEFMHGVAHFAVSRRTGSGLISTPIFDGLGPVSVPFGGQLFPCDTTVIVFSDGSSFPLFCVGGRYQLASNHTGAIDEGFADMFGTSAEFFFQPTGSGNLKADYLIGEDVQGLGASRSLINPRSLTIPTTTSPIPYPDHFGRRLRLAVMIVQGTRSNPIALALTSFVILDGNLFALGGDDQGGVHWNSTVLSHAFYLAIEGGRNQTSGRTAVGVGAANRHKIEQVFLRAMTEMMPSAATLPVAGAVIRQSAVDLFGSSAVSAATNQALSAVGL